MKPPSIDEQLAALTRGCEEIYRLDDLRQKLERAGNNGRQLRIKLGLDPSAPDIHLGHAVVLRKMRQFQDLGHKAVLIIGDYTAMIGDPTGRSKTRPVLSPEQIDANAATYLQQAGRILDTSPEKLEIRRNSEWLAPMTFADVLKLAAKMTVARMLERDTFAKRYSAGVEIYIHEFLYPLMQGHDSVAIRADVELGGTDQTFNNLVGRDFQADAGQEPQVVMIMPILVGLDGKEKMSKSLGNYVGVSESAHDMFGKLMSVPDDCMRNYYTLLTNLPPLEVARLCDPKQTHPMEAKKRLAETIASAFHDAASVQNARHEWEGIHQKSARAGEPLVVPADAPSVAIGPDIVQDGKALPLKLIVACGFASSNGEARRLIDEKGIRLNGELVADPAVALAIKTGDVLQRGKRKFVRLSVSPP
jgi:tyrosyl-tRNA synthetase